MKNSNSKTIISLISLVCIWGSVWPIYKYALQFSPPVLFSGIRSIIAGLLFALILLPQWRQIKWRENWSIYVISSIFNVILFYGMQSIGLQYLPAGLYSVIVYFQPVLVVVLAWPFLKEPLTRNKMIGVFIGFLGVVMVSLDGISGKVAPIGFVFALITAIGWAIGTIYVKVKSNVVHGFWLVALQNIIGGFCMLFYGLGAEDIRTIEWNASFIVCLIYGAIFGVAIAFVLYNRLMSKGEAGKVSSFTFLVPLIAVLLGTIFLDEPFTISLILGMALIILSIYLINKKSHVVTEE
ncbi:DMT family transporter [Ureibacillus sp. 179-F W5.1 NHS]|uniref:DMT family transporter n=1 Tax=Lysinibacillus halotolerans TaxID=1368476 RepID=A0A3M8HB78_9BACI|nr:DMT family transporter [Lysinibacillus halotolerans]RNC99569.1 DMT family transporter [Lysinibacillus halotolerans]